MLSLASLTDVHLQALASWVSDLLVQRAKHGFFTKSRVETPIRLPQDDVGSAPIPPVAAARQTGHDLPVCRG